MFLDTAQGMTKMTASSSVEPLTRSSAYTKSQT
jgi:hypothetical protein